MKKFDFKNIKANRTKTGINQSEFWTRYGVTQSGGSRYESGRNLPTPVAMLIWLRETGVIDDKQLAAAKKGVEKR